MNKQIENAETSDKVAETKRIVDNLNADKHVTEEEFQNFMHRVTEVEKIVKKLASSDSKEQEHGKLLADQILEKNVQKEISEFGELKVKSSRTMINKYSTEPDDPERMSREAFMRSVEKDAKQRAESRKIRNERAETLKRIGNGAFKEGDFEKAITYFNKAIEQRKDSAVLWNNRALSYMNLGLFEKALHDCEWALKVNNSNLKALLNSAKCYINLGNKQKCEEFLRLAKERNPHFGKFINDFQRNIRAKCDGYVDQKLDTDEIREL